MKIKKKITILIVLFALASLIFMLLSCEMVSPKTAKGWYGRGLKAVKKGDYEQARENADVVIKRRLYYDHGTAAAMENR